MISIDERILIKVVNEVVPLGLLVALGVVLYRGMRENQRLLLEREDLLRRYILFRGDKQARLKVYGRDERVQRELLRTLSSSWKHFQKRYDEYLNALARNASKTKLFLWLIALGLFVNTARLLGEEYYFYDVGERFFFLAAKELSYYVWVVFSFFLLGMQTKKFLPLKGEAVKADRETLFFSNDLSVGTEKEGLFNEFDPLWPQDAEKGEDDEQADPDPNRRDQGRGRTQRVEDSPVDLGGLADRREK